MQSRDTTSTFREDNFRFFGTLGVMMWQVQLSPGHAVTLYVQLETWCVSALMHMPKTFAEPYSCPAGHPGRG